MDELTDTLLTEPEPTPVLGIDETRRGKPRWLQDPDTGSWHRVDRWDTGFVDLHGNRALPRKAEGRTAKSYGTNTIVRNHGKMLVVRTANSVTKTD